MGCFHFDVGFHATEELPTYHAELLEHVGDTPGWPRFGKPAISVGKLTYFHGGFSTSNCKRLPFPVCY